jgi:hypothetical protein
MNHLDDLLRNALRRRDPPAGFAERVMASARAEVPSRDREGAEVRPGPRHWFAFPGWKWAAAAAICALVVGGAVIDHRARADARRELARRQFVLALQITGDKLEFVREQLRGAAARDSVELPAAARLLTLSGERK